MNYDIIPTLGPASAMESQWQEMYAAGATAFRLNTSHLTIEQCSRWLEWYSRFWPGIHIMCPPLVLDLQGSKWRLGEFANTDLAEGEIIQLRHCAEADRPHILPVPHADFFRAAAVSGGEIVLNDAKIRLAIESTGEEVLTARVTQGGAISARKGITFSSSEYRKETLSEKDQTIVRETAGFEFVRFAVSYVKDTLEMRRYRELIQKSAGRNPYLIAKLERRQAVDEAVQMAGCAEALWLCRGDLGAEAGLPGMAELAFRLTGQLNQLSVPVILAGQVLEHMVEHAHPTRSEVYTIYDALSRGYRGVVLSDETAVGRYPLEACRTAAIFRETAKYL